MTRTRDVGYATAELAVALPSLVLVLLASVWILSAVSVESRCAEAARIAARAAARGDDPTSVTARAAAAAPRGAHVQTSRTGGLVEVRVETPLQPMGVLAKVLPPLTATGGATAEVEDGGAP